MQLRAYQQTAVDCAWDFLRNRPGNPALVLPTGAGKSPLMAALAREAVKNWQGRVGIVAHVQELVQQNADKLRTYWPDAPMGVYAAGLKRRDRFDRIIFAQIQSVAKRAATLGRFDLLLIDEAHRVPLSGEGMYRQFIDDCRRFNPALRVIGLTATPYRLQGAAIPVCGPNHVLTEIAYEARIPDLIAQGYLSPLISKAGERPNLAGVHMRGGEYIESELAERMDDAGLIGRTCDDLVARAQDRRTWIVFCVNVAHAEHVRDALAARGIAAGLVHAGTTKAERARLIAAFQSGSLRAIVNVNVLSEGFDAPHIDCVAMLRPTKSPGLYYQQVGRGFRMSPDKADCLVLDYAGNMLEHGPVDAIRVQQPRRAGAKAEVRTGQAKECPACSAILAIAVRVCECGHAFGSGEPGHLDRPVDAPVLSSQRERVIARHAVENVAYNRHDKPGKTPSLRVTYQCGMRQFSEWVCIEHAGFARAKALHWWAARAGDGQVPRTIEEALSLAWMLPTPTHIEVDETNKYPDITDYEFAECGRESSACAGDEADARGFAESAGHDAMQSMRGVPGWLLRAVESQRAA